MTNAGYLTTNSRVAWPFDENDPSLDRDVAGMFADGAAMLQPQEFGAKVFVSDVSVGGGVLRFEVRKEFADGDSVSSPVEVPVSGGPYAVADSSWFFFVIDCDGASRMDGASWPGRSFRLDAAACGAEAERVRSISLYRRGEDGWLEPIALGIRGDVTVRAGNNAYVGPDVSETGFVALDRDEAANRVVVTADAGLGLGTVPCNESNDSNDYHSGDGMGSFRPDAEGNVVIEADQCYQVSPDEHRRQLTASGDGAVHVLVTGRCTACCQCDDFVRLNDRLADASESVVGAYGDLMYSRSVYESAAEKWNRELFRISGDDFVARVIVMGQRLPYASVNMPDTGIGDGHDIYGSIDRAQAVLSLKNLSPVDATVSVSLEMEPQRIALANVIVPNGSGSSWTGAESHLVRANGRLALDDVPISAGSGITVRVYGALEHTFTPDSRCGVSGKVTFSWMERVNCPDDSNDRHRCWERRTVEKYVHASQNMSGGGGQL